MSKLINYYEKLVLDKCVAGFSDIRMWPGYMAFSSLSLFAAHWIGLFWAIVLVGVPSLVLVLKKSGLLAGTKSSHLPQSEAVYLGVEEDSQKNKVYMRKAQRDMKLIRLRKQQAAEERTASEASGSNARQTA